ncbi:intermembrane phospholipid transport protein YdbH family protein [Pelagerythrobacter marensis]|uniref:Exoprotein n=1 Tax=Pelagerythrobacter marensis TaxID=543877 RepID=A0A0G3X8M3_9SPHN|nr:YdbH domain-containing protein [Pelagerythrobacter marensis]AKM06708.1 Exoprotein [Pelagerythrobacter marensis]
MALAEDEMGEGPETAQSDRRAPRWRLRLSLFLLALIAAALAALWFSREQIAEDVIAGMLEDYDLPAQYEIESIGPEQQILRNVVVGDPTRPDLTIERVIVNLRYRFGTPAIGRVTLERPRLFGTLREDRVSFGALDRVLFAESDAPPGLPDLDLELIDGRALVESDYGPIGIKAEGEGELDGGFDGRLAVVAPALEGAGCRADGASLYGRLTTSAGKPAFEGPLRLAGLTCAGGSAALADLALTLEVTGDADLAGYEGQARLASGRATLGETRAKGVNANVRASWRDRRLTARYSLVGRGVSHPQAQFAVLTAKGGLRAREGFARVEVDADVEGNGLRMGQTVSGALDNLARGNADTLIAPLARRMAGALRREERGSRVAGNLTWRLNGDAVSAVVPNATLRGGSGATLLALSRVHYLGGDGGAPRLTGNFRTGGEGLPQMVGRMEQLAGRDPVLRLRMADYAAGDARIALPEFVVAQGTGGQLGFSGRAVVSGALPGGEARGLIVPLDGHWSPARGLALWHECTDFRFDRLEMANLVLERRGLRLCPPRTGPMLAYDARGLRLAAGAPSLDLAGELAGTAIRLESGAVGFAWPGNLSARDVNVALGPESEASTFSISEVQATLGNAIEGTFADADVGLFAVPLDLRGTSGLWRYADGVFAIEQAGFVLEDRSEDDRFRPLMARDATLQLENNAIRAEALLREPTSDREVARVTIAHDLGRGAGHADLSVAGLVFDEALQPDMLSELALGVIANARGTVTGTGRIDWNADEVTSSGRFSSEGLDFAAAFGPVRGAAGTIVFSDLINLTTVPGQRLQVASVNPGVEATGGEVEFALRDGQYLSVAGGTWPFMGGTLTLRPVDLNFGASEERAYVFEIEGLDAATFVQQLDLGNISATGTFDGELPIVFDAAGNGRIESGRLISREPGGSVSYVGELTYEDLSPIANFAFDALRALEYRRMAVEMNGSLSGEIITEVRFEGVSQGEGTSKNLITRKIASLPLEFRVNIRAAFTQLLTNLRSLYDPAFVRDPRELGLLADDGERLQRRPQPNGDTDQPENSTSDEPSVQTQESETMP